MELLSRDLQRTLLKKLSELYPLAADARRSFHELGQRQVEYNLFYLREHGLVELNATKMMDGSYPIASASITAKGIDFITDDGGLGAVLGVVTIKLHEDTIKALLIDKIERAHGDQNLKDALISRIKALPSEALGSVAQRALDAGLDQMPDLLTSLYNWLG